MQSESKRDSLIKEYRKLLEKAEKEGKIDGFLIEQLERMRIIAEDKNRERFSSPVVDD